MIEPEQARLAAEIAADWLVRMVENEGNLPIRLSNRDREAIATLRAFFDGTETTPTAPQGQSFLTLPCELESVEPVPPNVVNVRLRQMLEVGIGNRPDPKLFKETSLVVYQRRRLVPRGVDCGLPEHGHASEFRGRGDHGA